MLRPQARWYYTCNTARGGEIMGTISLRVPDKELDLYKDYARVLNRSLSAVIRATMMERIEDEYDLQTIARYEKQKGAGEAELYSHDDVWTELGV